MAVIIARHGEVFALVVAQGMQLAAVGAVAGLLGATASTRYLRTLLFGVQPLDPTTFTLVTALLVVVALGACSIPAWRASRVDPMVALRCE
jgi:ABC-type lipoprotein release transport system permease subunit